MEDEHRTFLEDIDKLMVEQEKDIDNLKKENGALKKLGKSIKKEKKQLEKQITTQRNQLRTQLSKLGIVSNDSSENWEQNLTSFKKYFHRWVKERMNLEKLIE